MGPTRKLREDEVTQRKQKQQAQVLEKDATEEQLEKLLFGDEAGFLNSLREQEEEKDKALQLYGAEGTSDREDGDIDMEDVPDEDLFFLDAGTTDLPSGVAQDLQDASEDKDAESDRHRRAVWHDSDDDRLTISLASHTRLRKLRDTEDDDLITGTEYIRRLRRQYERLHPTPDWVSHVRKKRKLTNGEAQSDSDDSDAEITSSLTTTKSLAELLRTAGSFTASTPTQNGTRPQHRKLRPEIIDIQRVKDITSHGPSSIDTLQFHPTYPLILTGGPSSTLNLYHISPDSQTPNPLISSIHIKGNPLHTAGFHIDPSTPSKTTNPDPSTTRIFLTSRRAHYHTYTPSTNTLTRITRPLYNDPTSSKPTSLTTKPHKRFSDLRSTESFALSPSTPYIAFRGTSRKSGGQIHILSTTTHQWHSSVRIDSLGGVADYAWWRDGLGLSIAGKSGEVSEYSLSERRVLARWMDEGAVGTTVLALGGRLPADATETTGLGSDRYVAVGSSSGVVNIYDRRTIVELITKQQSSASAPTASAHTQDGPSNELATSSQPTLRPKPLKTLPHLTTPTSHLAFSPDGQMLVMASRWKKNALKVVHLPSATVYKNWPTDKTPLGRVSAVAISADGGYLAVGNEKGAVRLFGVGD